ncbi:MAG: serine hydrolase domain-containing protein [Cyclobacteriaceae bacterium]
MKNIRIYIVCLLFGAMPILISCELDGTEIPEHGFDYDQPWSQGINDQTLLAMNDAVIEGEYGNIRSMIILKNGKIVFENYYDGYSRKDKQKLGSATKSISSLLLGIAMEQKEESSVEDKIIDLLPDFKSYFEDIPQKDQISLRNILTNSSGIWWTEQIFQDTNPESNLQIMESSNNWIEYVLSRPMIREPGLAFNYNSGNSIILSPIIEHYAAANLTDFANEKLFQPLGISDWDWEQVPENTTNTASGLSLRPIDLAKIGQLMLDSGKWEQQSLVNDRWKRQSTQARYTLGSFTYGYQWWGISRFNPISYLVNRNDIYFAWGEGGQFLFVIPHMKIVFVTTAGNYNDDIELEIFNLFREYIIRSSPSY